MKAFITLVALFLASYTFSQELFWSTETEVASGYGNLRPRIALTSNNVPVVVWGGGTGTQPVYVSRLTGGAFSTPISVSPSGINPYTATWTGPDIAAKGDSVWVIYDAELNAGFDVYCVASTDAGVSFSDTVNISGYNGLNRFASIGSNVNGDIAVSYMTHDANWVSPRYVVSNSIDAGATWLTPINASEALSGTGVCDCCPSEIILNGSDQALLFRGNNANLRDMWTSFSSDGGVTFPIGADVDDAEWLVNLCPSSGAHGAFINNVFYMVWMTGASGTSKAMITTVDKSNAVSTTNWEMPGTPQGGQNFPRIAGEGNTIGVVYQEYISGSPGQECYFAYTFNGDSKLDSLTLLNAQSLGSQSNPDLVFADGVFHFVYQNSYTGGVTYRTAIVGSVGVNEVSKTISIFPNPAVNEIELEGASNSKIHVLNQLGERMLSKNVYNEKESIDCSQFATGTYFIQVIQNNQLVQSKKIVVIR
jgi:hypothetical protein